MVVAFRAGAFLAVAAAFLAGAFLVVVAAAFFAVAMVTSFDVG